MPIIEKQFQSAIVFKTWLLFYEVCEVPSIKTNLKKHQMQGRKP